MVSPERRDYYAGALTVTMGLLTAYFGSQLQIGAMTRMGPGFFPTALGVLITFMGVLILLARRSEGPPPDEKPDALHPMPSHVDVRGWGCIIASIVGFILFCEYGGLVPATFFCVFVAAMGDREFTWLGSAALATGITIFGWAVFSYILRVPIPAFGGLST